jgi:hypothetical protein
VALKVDTVEALAPDRASLDAARKLLNPAHWPLRGRDGGGLVWGECQGSGSAPYRIALSPDDSGYKCTCPSRKFPCKHTLALMLQFARAPADFAPALAAPDWVIDWSTKRKPRAAPAPAPVPQSQPIAHKPEPAPEPERDEKAEARAAAQRERLRLAREAAILAGLDELDRWLADRIEAGLSGFPAIAHEQCRLLARRLADAKAPGLALMLDDIPRTLLALPQPERIPWLIPTLGRLHLLASAYRRQDRLPGPLREDVRRLAGWTTERARLLADPEAIVVEATWRVIATLAQTQVDGLRRLETWLARGGPGEPGFALLLDYVPASQPSASGFVPGESFAARLVFFPSAAPLRAVIGQRGAGVDAAPDLPAHATLAAALDGFESVLAAMPFMEHWPLAISGVTIADTVTGLVLAGPDGGIGLPLATAPDDGLLPLLGRDMTAAGLWNGRVFRLLAADTDIGPWYLEER